MEIDQFTLEDLAIFSTKGDEAVFSYVNRCRTDGGSEKLMAHFCNPLGSLSAIKERQSTLQLMIKHIDQWPDAINNGAVMVIEKYFGTVMAEIPSNPSALQAGLFKLLNKSDLSFLQFSCRHLFAFIRGMEKIIEMYSYQDDSASFKKILLEAASILNNRELKKRTQSIPFSDYTLAAQLDFAHFFKYKFKHATLQLLDIYYQLDAWYGMASATLMHKLVFPEFFETHRPLLEIEGLYHPLLEHPVDYYIELNNQQNFLFLTGANMAGKSTFIKSLGIATFMAHLGMGVPAKKMTLSLFDGILSNINISDNLARGESYFFNEVNRIKMTVQKISDQRHWLVLIDELFKGTNVEDAMKCSTAVIEGFAKIKSSVFLLSTHLYEIGSNLKKHPNILFKYFETDVTGEKLHFSYELKEGISQDRLGYLILKNEGVVEMLDKIPSDN